VRSKVPQIVIVTFIALLSSGIDARADSSEPLLRFFKGDPMLREMYPGEPVRPPYKIELWVESSHGLHKQGTKYIIQDWLRQDLMALGDVEVGRFLSATKSNSAIRLRVWFSQLEKPALYECYDITIAVVVGKIVPDNPLAEIVIDAYSLSGVASRDLNSLCQKIAARLDLKILADLRRTASSSRKEQSTRR
jgi:hypothetical protein